MSGAENIWGKRRREGILSSPHGTGRGLPSRLAFHRDCPTSIALASPDASTCQRYHRQTAKCSCNLEYTALLRLARALMTVMCLPYRLSSAETPARRFPTCIHSITPAKIHHAVHGESASHSSEPGRAWGFLPAWTCCSCSVDNTQPPRDGKGTAGTDIGSTYYIRLGVQNQRGLQRSCHTSVPCNSVRCMDLDDAHASPRSGQENDDLRAVSCKSTHDRMERIASRQRSMG